MVFGATHLSFYYLTIRNLDWVLIVRACCHAHRLERPQLCHDGFRVAEQQRLSDLQFEPVRREAGFLERSSDDVTDAAR